MSTFECLLFKVWFLMSTRFVSEALMTLWCWGYVVWEVIVISLAIELICLMCHMMITFSNVPFWMETAFVYVEPLLDTIWNYIAEVLTYVIEVSEPVRAWIVDTVPYYIDWVRTFFRSSAFQ